MALHVALTSPELTALAGPHTVKTYLYAIKGTATATARINGTPSSFPLPSLVIDGVSGNWASVDAGMTFAIGSAAGLADRGLYRVRAAGDSTTLNAMELSNGDAGLVPIAVRTSGVIDNDYVTVYLDRHDIWAVAPRIDYPGSGAKANIYEDYSAAVGTSNTTPGPIVNMGDNLLLFVDDGQSYATWTFVVTAPYWPSAASISSYLYTVDASWTVTGGSIATATFTARIPVGEYSLYCTVTDGAGGISTGVRNVVVQNRSGANSPIPIVSYSDTWDRLGWTATLDIVDTQLANIADGAMVIIKQEATFNGSTSVTAAQTFVGWVIRQTETSEPGLRSATLEIVGPAGLMAKLPGYSQYFELAITPSTWQQIASGLNYVDFLVRWMVEHRAKNLVELFDWTRMGISNLSGRNNVWKIQGQTLLAQVQDLVQAYNANFGCNPNGEFMVRQHPSLLDTTARNAIVERGTITASIVARAALAREMRHSLRFLWGEGFYYDGTTVVPVKSVAPGNAPGQGVGEERLDRQLVDSQADLDYRTEREYQRRNNPYADMPFDIPGNWGAVIYPAEMEWLRVNIAAAYRPTNAAFNNRTVPIRVRRTFSEGGVVDSQLETEGETDSVQGQPVPIPVGAAANLYGNYSGRSFVQPPATWGNQNGLIPFAWLHATNDGYVVATTGTGGTFRNISPSATQRAAIGTAIKMIADPSSYKRLILFGSTGALACDDATASSPTWRILKVSTTGIPITADTFLESLSVSSGGSTATTSTTTNSSKTYRLVISGTFEYGGPGSMADAFWRFNSGGSGIWDAWPVPYGTQIDGLNYAPAYESTHIYTLSLSGTGSTFAFKLNDNFYGDNSGSFTVDLYEVGSSGGSSEALISDISGSINRPGYFCWLSKKTVGGSDYVYFNATTNYFSSIGISTRLAAYVSTVNYAISPDSYNSGSIGVFYVLAGNPGGSDCRAYKTTNWGTSFAALSSALNSRSGGLNIPYDKAGGASNSGASPQYVVVKGLNGANLESIGLDGATHTMITGGSKHGEGPYSLHSFTQDGGYLGFVTTDGTFITSSNGTTWSAKTSVPKTGSTVYGITGSPTNKLFYLGFGDQCLAYSSDGGTSWTDKWSTYNTWRSANLGSTAGKIIISAFADLSMVYSRPITQ